MAPSTGQDDAAAAQKNVAPKVVPLKQLFRFADRLDVFMFWTCILCSAAQGAALPG